VVTPEKNTRVVLCIDDCASLLECLDLFLQDLGYTVLTASSGARGLELLLLQPVDVVIVDYQMPGMNGCEVAQAMRTLGLRTPIILFSGMAPIPVDCLNLVDVFIPKAQPSSWTSVEHWVQRLTEEVVCEAASREAPMEPNSGRLCENPTLGR
jgi:CheY-like chemotaxis protein